MHGVPIQENWLLLICSRGLNPSGKGGGAALTSFSVAVQAHLPPLPMHPCELEVTQGQCLELIWASTVWGDRPQRVGKDCCPYYGRRTKPAKWHVVGSRCKLQAAACLVAGPKPAWRNPSPCKALRHRLAPIELNAVVRIRLVQ